MTNEEMRREMMLNGNDSLCINLTGATAYYDKGGSAYGHGTVVSANLTVKGEIMMLIDRGIGRTLEIVLQKHIYRLHRMLQPAGLFD